jgi:hypothetical protein
MFTVVWQRGKRPTVSTPCLTPWSRPVAVLLRMFITREEESFYVLEGEVTFLIGDQRVVATAGMFANVSTGCLHAFKNESDKPARMIITVAPAGLEKMFLEVGHPVSPTATEAPRPTQADIDKLLAIAPSYGIENPRAGALSGDSVFLSA